MAKQQQQIAVVAGVGPGLGAALCRAFSKAGYAVAGLARTTEFTDELAGEIADAGGAMRHYACDVTDPTSVEHCFTSIDETPGEVAALVYNAGAFAMHPLAETPLETFDRLWTVNARGAFLCARRVVGGMLERGRGSIVFTGATASVKAGAQFAAFGSSKFALRGLAQGMARELGPQGIHVAHVLVDGMIWTPRTAEMPGVNEHDCLDPEAIAASYLHLIGQDRSAWTFELDLRPSVEPF